MRNHPLSPVQVQLDTDLRIIALTSFASFFLYMLAKEPLMDFITDSSIFVLPRLLAIATLQFGVAGLGITIVRFLRKEKWQHFGLVRKGTVSAIALTVLCFLPSILLRILSGQFRGYQPFSIFVTDDVLAADFPVSVFGMLLIALI